MVCGDHKPVNYIYTKGDHFTWEPITMTKSRSPYKYHQPVISNT